MVPVADEKAFLEFLESFNLKLQKGGDGVYSLAGQAPVPVYLRFAHKYAYITIKDRTDLCLKSSFCPARSWMCARQKWRLSASAWTRSRRPSANSC